MATSIIKHDDTGWITLDSSVSYRKKNGVIFVRKGMRCKIVSATSGGTATFIPLE